jgi:hypothetical protein
MNKKVCFVLFSMSLLVMAILYGCSNAPKTLGNENAGEKAIAFEHLPVLGAPLIGLNIDDPVASLAGPLGYYVVSNSYVTGISWVNSHINSKKVFYAFAHGLYSDSLSRFVGLKLDNDYHFQPSDVPPNQEYDLVFINGCFSGDGLAGTTGFIASFGNPNGYIGWKDEIIGGICQEYAREFFDSLNGDSTNYSPTIQEAITRTYPNLTTGTKNYVDNNLAAIGNLDMAIDLIPYNPSNP